MICIERVADQERSLPQVAVKWLSLGKAAICADDACRNVKITHLCYFSTGCLPFIFDMGFVMA